MNTDDFEYGVENSKCTTAEIASYKQRGFLVAKGLVPKKSIEIVHCELSQILYAQIRHLNPQSTLSCQSNTVYELLRALFDMDQVRYLACLRLAARLYSLQALMMHPAVRAYCHSLGIEMPVMQSRTVFHVMSNELKFGNGYFGFDVHQDWPSLQSSLDMVTVWIPLVDVDANLFPIEAIPGSHLKGLCRGGMSEHINTIDPSEYQESEFVRLDAQRGDVVFMTAFCLHRSAVDGRDHDVRLAASCRYENAMEQHVIEHAYPYSQQNIIRREPIIENFPTQEQVKAVFSHDAHSSRRG